MATTLNSLSAADKADFLKRLAVFGLDGSSVLQPDLVVQPRTTLTLSSTSPNSFLRPHMLTTSNLDELKGWIGIPDQHFQKGLLASTMEAPPPISKALAGKFAAPIATFASPVAATRAGTATNVALQGVTSKDMDSLRTAAMSYIWGQSSVSASYKTVVEAAFKNFQVAVWPFYTITVSAGSVLEIGSGPHVLCAWKIIIQQGGQIRGVGTNLHVQCTILEKTQTIIRNPGLILSNLDVELPN
jgi:hypothetical protein